MYNDSILITLNKPHQDGYFIEFYNLVNKKNIGQLFKYGNGPKEMLSAIIYLNQNQLYVNDYVKAQLAIVNMDSINDINLYNIQVWNHQVMSSPTAVICDDKFVLENPFYFEDSRYNIKQGKSRLITTDGKQPYKHDKYEYYTRNVNVDGCIITNENLQRIMYAPLHYSIVELYDYQLNHIKTFEKFPPIEREYRIKSAEGPSVKDLLF